MLTVSVSCFETLHQSDALSVASAEAQMMEPSKFSDRRAMDAGEACEICHHDHDHVSVPLPFTSLF